MDSSQETLIAIQALEKLRDSYKEKYLKTDEMIVMLGGISSIDTTKDNNITDIGGLRSSKTNFTTQVLRKALKDDFSKLTVIEKVIYLIKEADKFLRRPTIESFAESKGSPFTGSIASTMSSAKKEGKYGLTLVERNGISAWGLKEWVDENNEVLDEHYFKFTNAE